jgi:hypothetical protein
MGKYICAKCGTVRIGLNDHSKFIECIECDGMAAIEGYQLNLSIDNKDEEKLNKKSKSKD